MPKPELVKRALEEMRRRAVSYEYFFDHLSSADWIEPLAQAGMFRDPPPLQQKGEYISFPFWPESRYLARVTSAAPELVLKIALGIPETENIRVYEDLADMALAMPGHLAAKLLPKLKRGIESPYHLSLPEKLGQLIAHLAAEHEIEAALDLAQAILVVLPDPHAGETQRPTASPQCRFHTWDYEQILTHQMPVLVQMAGIRALLLLCRLLDDAVRLSLLGPDRAPSDASGIWRLAVETDEERPTDLENLLVSAVRDAANGLMASDGAQVLAIVERQRYRIFHRIGLHLRRLWPQVDLEGTARLLHDTEFLDDIDVQHELYCLLKDRFREYPPTMQQAYLALVDRGPGMEPWLCFREKKDSHSPSSEQQSEHIRRWQYARLVPIQDYLERPWRERFEDFRAEFGEMEHPDFPHFYQSSTWIGPTSPKSAEELDLMSVGELVEFLRTWRPSGQWMSPSAEGLGRMLTQIASANPAPYALEAHRFEGVEPTYVRGLVSGLEEAIKSKRPFPWRDVLGLCSWVVEQPRELPGRPPEMAAYADLDPGWVWARHAIASLLSAGLESGPASIPFDLRSAVWTALEPLTDDPEPTLEYEEQYGGANMDPATVSINTTRGEAMHAVVHYALWIRRNLGEATADRSFDAMPEVRRVLDLHLDPRLDAAVSVRAIYGQWFPQLEFLDPQWAAENVERIFPSDETQRCFRDAAWETYITFCGPYDEVFALLENVYSSAIDRIGVGRRKVGFLADPDERLAEHLMILFARGRLQLDDSNGLLSKFYAKADDKLRAHALGFVGRHLQNKSEPMSPEVLERLRSLWLYRLGVARDSDSLATFITELASFGWWFPSEALDPEWSMAQLKEVLERVGTIEDDDRVLERLATLSVSMPLDTVGCLNLLFDHADFWQFHSWRQHARTILGAALHSGNVQAAKRAIDTINRLGARGNLEYRDLLREGGLEE